MKKTNTLALALVCSLTFHNVRAETCAGIAYDLADIAQDLTDLLVSNEEILISIGDKFYTLEPLAKLAIEDDLLAKTAKMKKGPGPSWC